MYDGSLNVEHLTTTRSVAHLGLDLYPRRQTSRTYSLPYRSTFSRQPPCQLFLPSLPPSSSSSSSLSTQSSPTSLLRYPNEPLQSNFCTASTQAIRSRRANSVSVRHHEEEEEAVRSSSSLRLVSYLSLLGRFERRSAGGEKLENGGSIGMDGRS